MGNRADFVTAEECNECLTEKKAFKPRALIEHLRVEFLYETGLVSKAKLLYRHTFIDQLDLGNWTYLTEHDFRSFELFTQLKEKGKPFYITLGTGFLRVTAIRTNAEGILEFILESVHTDQSNLN